MKRIFTLCLALCLLLCSCNSNGTSSVHESNDLSKAETSKDSSEGESASNDDTSTEILESDTLEQMIAKMTVKEKIGQMLMLSIRSWEGEDITDSVPEELEEVIRKYNVGNVILFAENFTDIQSTVKLTESLQNSLNIDIPMFIGVDQEGGNVVRLSNGCSLVGNMALGAIGKEDSAYTAGEITGQQLSALGVNLNLAPTLDVNNNPQNPVINIRSFSEDPEAVAKLGISMIKGMQNQNVISCAKHFPGHGDTETDSHYGLPVIDKSYSEIKKMELIPFQAAIDGGIGMIMTAHIQFPQVESQEKNGLILPATLSKKILTDILKVEMGFDGVVITDSMQMDAISSHFTAEEACIIAINAGVDILLMPVNVTRNKDINDLRRLINVLSGSVESGDIPMERVDDAVRRILKAKKDANLWEKSKISLEEKISSALEIVGNPDHKAKERELASKAVTILENKTGNLFSTLTDGNLLFCVPSDTLSENVRFALDRLAKENSVSITYKIKKYGESLYTNLDDYDGIVIITDTSASWDVGEALDIYEKSINNNKKTAVISSRLPYDTALFKNADCLLACYCPKGGAPETSTSAFGVNVAGAIEVLLGTANAEGKLPVTVYNVNKRGKIDFNKVIYPKGYCV